MTFLNRVEVNSIPELELKLVELKMESDLTILELQFELKTGIDFLQLLPQS